MEFFFFHLMPWPHLPADFDQRYDSAWVWLPNSLYDPSRATTLPRVHRPARGSPKSSASTASASTSITRTPTA